MPDWTSQAWVGISGWLLFVAAAVKVVQATFAAERDRKALAAAAAEREKLDLEIRQLKYSLESAELQREKLSLEIQLLRNSPELVADRRVIYDRLRATIGEISRDGAATLEQVRAMHAIRHDSEFVFPRELADRLLSLANCTFELYWSHRLLSQPPPGITESHRQAAIEDDDRALKAVVAFEKDLVATFRPYLIRAGN